MNRAITPQAIWTAGIALLVVDASQRPYWHTVWKAVTTGKAPKTLGGRAYDGLWLTAGGLVMLALLASLAAGSDSGGDLAGAFLVVLWAGWLITHPAALSSLTQLFTASAAPAANGPTGGGTHLFL